MTGRAYPPDLAAIERFIDDIRADPDREEHERARIQQERVEQLPVLEWQLANRAAQSHSREESEWQFVREHLKYADRPTQQGAPAEEASNRLAQAVYNLKTAGLWPWAGEYSHDIDNYESLSNVARELGMTRQNLAAGIASGSIPAKRVGSQWLIHRSTIPLIQARRINNYSPYREAVIEERAQAAARKQAVAVAVAASTNGTEAGGEEG